MPNVIVLAKSPAHGMITPNVTPELVADMLYRYAEATPSELMSGTVSNLVYQAGLRLFDTNTNNVYEDFDDDTFAVTLTGDWMPGTTVSHEGTRSLMSQNHGNSSVGTEYIDFTCSVPVTLSLWYYVSSEAIFDKFSLYLDDVVKVNNASGNVGWTPVSYAVSPGSHRVKLVYSKDSSSNSGNDLAAIDDFRLSTTPVYVTSGQRTSEAILMRGTATANSTISWLANVPANTSLTIKVAVTATDTMPADAAFVEATNGGLVPGIAVDDILDGLYMWVREILTTTDTTVTPVLSSLSTGIEIVYSTTADLFTIEVDITSLLSGVPSASYQSSTWLNAPAYTDKTFTTTALAKGFYYWRAKVLVNSVTYYSNTRAFIIDPGIKRRILSVYENVAKLGPAWRKKRTLSVYENIAKKSMPVDARAWYQYDNIVHEPPFPTLYALSSTRGEAGSIVTAYGNGFGNRQTHEMDIAYSLGTASKETALNGATAYTRGVLWTVLHPFTMTKLGLYALTTGNVTLHLFKNGAKVSTVTVAATAGQYCYSDIVAQDFAIDDEVCIGFDATASYMYARTTEQDVTIPVGLISFKKAAYASALATYPLTETENIPAVSFGYQNEETIGYGGEVYYGDTVCNVLSWSWNQIMFQIPSDADVGGLGVFVRLAEPAPIRDSGIIGFEVTESTFADNIGIELFICDKHSPNTILCQLENATNKSFQLLLNQAGSGKFTISRYDEKVAFIEEQNYVLCRLDGIDVFKWVIESINPSHVSSDEQQLIDVSGRGSMSILSRGIVYPLEMPSPASLERTFSGVHAGAILRMLILEAQARGCFPDISIDWTDTTDSIGNPFDDTTSISFHAGTPLTEVIEKFSNGMGLFIVELRPSMRMKLYKTHGEDLSSAVVYRPGQGILDGKKSSTSQDLQNTILVEGSEGVIVETLSPYSQATFGRKEGYLQAQNIPHADLPDYGEMFLKDVSGIKWSIVGTVCKVEFKDGTRIKPLESYIVGDWIGWYIPPEGGDTVGLNEKLRVKGITFEENNDSGAMTYTLDLNSLLLEYSIRLAQHTERMSSFTSMTSSLSAVSTETPLTSDKAEILYYDKDTVEVKLSGKAASTHDHNALYAPVVHQHAFLDLSDTPSGYDGHGGKVVAVKSDASGLEFITGSGGGGGIESYALFSGSNLMSGRTENGFGQYFTPNTSMTIDGGYFASDWTLGTVFTANLYDPSGTLVASGTLTGDGSINTRKLIPFGTPVMVTPLSMYCIVLQIASGNIQKYYDPAIPQAFFFVNQAFSGTIASQTASPSPYSIGLKITLG